MDTPSLFASGAMENLDVERLRLKLVRGGPKLNLDMKARGLGYRNQVRSCAQMLKMTNRNRINPVKPSIASFFLGFAMAPAS